MRKREKQQKEEKITGSPAMRKILLAMQDMRLKEASVFYKQTRDRFMYNMF